MGTRVVEKGDQQSISMISSYLEDHAMLVRVAAVEALGSIVEKGDRLAISALISRLYDEKCYVRSAAMNVLPRIVQKGDQYATTSLRALLKKHGTASSQEARCVLHKIA